MAKSQKAVKRKRKKGAPDWATAPFDNYLAESQRLGHVVRLSSRGISMLRGAPRIIEVLMKVQEDDSPETSESLENAKIEAELAQHEVDSGFPVLHAWAIVGLWAILESLIRTFVAEWLKHKRTAWQVESIERLRIRLGQYELIPRKQKHMFVTELLEKELGAGLKSGVTRFEALLKPFGLSGDVPDNIRQIIYEFGQVRNVIAHRGSKIDRQLLDACPWIGGQIDSDLHVSAEMFTKYQLIAQAYIVLIICRVGEYYGVDMSESRASILEDIDQKMPNKSGTLRGN